MAWLFSTAFLLSAGLWGRREGTIHILFLFLILNAADTEFQMSCLVGDVCVLPCHFTAAGSEVIHWYRGNTKVHSFYQGRDQLDNQDSYFQNRTSLFGDQIASGNASLLLKRTQVQDGGEYKCYSSNSLGKQEFFVFLEVSAPIQSVDMEVKGGMVRCLSQNIYPAPNVSWSTNPSESSNILQPFTNYTEDSDGLFSVESEVRIIGNHSDLTYICSITSADRTQAWRSSLKSQENMTGTVSQALTIPCLAPPELTDFTLTWSFMSQEKLSTILTFSSRTGESTTNWSPPPKLDETQAKLGNGSLQLLNLHSQENAGTYNCTFAGFQRTHTVLTHISITGAAKDGSSNNVGIIIVAIFGVLVLLGAAGCCIYFTKKGCSKDNNQNSSVPDEDVQISLQLLNDNQLNKLESRDQEQAD